MITIFKIEHHTKLYIGIQATTSYEKKQLETLKNLRSSNIYKCVYLPYTTESYTGLKHLNLPFTISKNGSADQSESKCDSVHIGQQVDKSTASSSELAEKVTIPEKYPGIIEIEWSGKFFTVCLPYQQSDSDFLKSLKQSYWSDKYQSWIVGSNIKNLEALKKHFVYWTPSEYQKLYELISLQEDPLIIEIYQSPEFHHKICLKISGFKINLAFIKQISGRLYDKRYRRWILPKDQLLIKRITKHYEDQGCKVVNRIASASFEKNIAPKAATGEKLRYLVEKLPRHQQGLIDQYASVMLVQKYGWATIKSYVRKFSKFLTYYHGEDINQLSAIQVNAFLVFISKKNISESLLNVYLSAIKLYYEKVSFRSEFHIERLQRPKKGRYLPVILSEKEVDSLLRQLKNLKHIALTYLIYSGGMRLGEVLGIRLKDIIWDRNQVLIRGGKGNKDRMTLLSQTLKEVLQNYFDEYQPQYWLFEGRDRNGPYSASSVQKIIRTAATKAGINRKVTPHTLRHCFATHLLDRGTDIRYIQELLGHNDIKTTLIYTHVTTRSLENIVSPLDRLRIPKEKV